MSVLGDGGINPDTSIFVTRVGKVVTRKMHIDELAVTHFALWPRSSTEVRCTKIQAPSLSSSSTTSAAGSAGVAGWRGRGGGGGGGGGGS